MAADRDGRGECPRRAGRAALLLAAVLILLGAWPAAAVPTANEVHRHARAGDTGGRWRVQDLDGPAGGTGR